MTKITFIDSGVCAPKGFSASGVHCGIRKNKNKLDLALIYSEKICSAASVYTQNKVQGAPIIVTKQNLKNAKAQAIVCNSGNANTCNADGIEVANAMCKSVANALKISQEDIIIASTGVIGQPLPLEKITQNSPALCAALKNTSEGSDEAANAILTTDLEKKELAVEFSLSCGTVCKIGAIAKGSGMIHPNMATMLVFITTDICISGEMLKKALCADVENSFNMLSVDGDTSTNDMLSILANGYAQNKSIENENEDYIAFCNALSLVTTTLCKAIAKDGEGATKLVVCNVSCAPSSSCAKSVAKSVITSSLLKAAMFGADANWGRVLCAIGYCDATFDINKVDVSFRSTAGTILVCKNGSGVEFCEASAKKILLQDEIHVEISLNDGKSFATAWGCDLTYDYVKINGDYRS